MSFDTQKQIAFTGIKNSELQALNMATAQLKRETKAKAYDAMLDVLKQVQSQQNDNRFAFQLSTYPTVRDIINVAELAK
jgi:hypothetical protein